MAEEENSDAKWQCMSCALRFWGEHAPEECPKCGSQLSFSRVADWRFF